MGITNFINIWKDQSDEFQKISGKNKLRQLLEIFYYNRIHGFSPSSYYQIPLFSEFSKRPLISDKSYHILERRLNPRKTGVISFDKWVQSCFWKANNLPHANTLGFIKENVGILNGEPIKSTEKELSSFFYGSKFPIAMKPINGANGTGFDIVDNYNLENKILVLRQKGELSLKSFKSYLFKDKKGTDGFIFQEYINQHPELNSFFSNSVNSLRVVTHMENNCNFSVDCALMKFGAGKSITDNNNEDGRIFAFMDITNGFLRKGFTGSFSQFPIDQHPDSKLQISGYRIPFWKECLELAITAHSHLPFLRHIGWDIAISIDGPLIIELNSLLAISIYQKGGNDLVGTTAFGKAFREKD